MSKQIYFDGQPMWLATGKVAEKDTGDDTVGVIATAWLVQAPSRREAIAHAVKRLNRDYPRDRFGEHVIDVIPAIVPDDSVLGLGLSIE